MDDASLRVSDANREQAVIALREHLLAGRLTLEEFSERVEAALRARLGGELARVQEDLPEVFVEAPGSRRKPARLAAALFSHVTRRGRLRLRGWTFAASAFGDLDFDLRQTTIDHHQTVVTVLAARCVARRLCLPPTPATRLGVGFVALAFLLIAEFSFVLWLRGLPIGEYLANRDPVAGTAYIVMLGAFSVMPVGC